MIRPAWRKLESDYSGVECVQVALHNDKSEILHVVDMISYVPNSNPPMIASIDAFKM